MADDAYPQPLHDVRSPADRNGSRPSSRQPAESTLELHRHSKTGIEGLSGRYNDQKQL